MALELSQTSLARRLCHLRRSRSRDHARIALAAIEAGADVIELGVPFSDPVADGPVIQRASERALRTEQRCNKCGVWREEIRKRSQAGLIIFYLSKPDRADRVWRSSAQQSQRPELTAR